MKVNDRSAKLAAKKNQMKKNGIAFKRLLIERAAQLKKKEDKTNG